MTRPALPCYEIYAIRYAHLERNRGQNFIQYDPHDGPMPMDYFVWVIKGADRHWLVDAGFGEAAAKARGRQLLRCPIEALQAVGLHGEEVTDVILTHLHYDHAGNLDKLPRARIHLQEKELQYATGRFMRFPFFRHAYSVEDVTEVVRSVYAERVTFYQGDAELAPGLSLVRVGGHTDGLQAVRVHTARGWVVLASDASHYYDNIGEHSPFPIVFHAGDMLEGFERLMSLADTPAHLVPGHDPLVRTRYPVHGDPANECHALHLAPSPH
jgi:glyoxylase-like metal-dependent hydrolase (beta-lactamase superfamily II)